MIRLTHLITSCSRVPELGIEEPGKGSRGKWSWSRNWGISSPASALPAKAVVSAMSTTPTPARFRRASPSPRATGRGRRR